MIDARRRIVVSEEPRFQVFRPERPGIRKVLGDLEAEVMEVVWQHPPSEGVTARDVFGVLSETRHAAYTTVMNTMTRLARKGLLSAEKSSQAYVYRPTMTQQQFVSRFVARVLEDLLVSFSGETLDTLEAFPDPEAAARARRLLDEIKLRRQTGER